jgi:TPR repeat protein
MSSIEEYLRRKQKEKALAIFSSRERCVDILDVVPDFQYEAGLGESGADVNRATCYLLGNGVDCNQSEGIRLLYEAVLRDHPNACLNLAICYVKGIGVESNHIEATRLFNKAASLGSIMALRFLGYCALKGFGSDLNAFEAVRLFKIAAAAGDIESCFELGRHYGGRRRARNF